MTPMSKARGQLLIKHVFYATLVLNTPFIVDNTLPTAATDMKSIFYNEKFIASLDTDTVMFVLVHEVMHKMFKHGLRRGGRKPHMWNIACDHAINLIMEKGGFKLWPSCYHDHKFEGMSAEQIYMIIDDDEKQKGNEGDIPIDGGFGGDLRDPEDLGDPAAVAQIERAIQQQVAQAAAAAKMMGQMPAGLDAIVNGVLNPPAPWQQLLQEYMTQVMKLDETWARRNRRFEDVILPTRHSEGMGELVIIGDSSGSMSGYFAQIEAEVNYVLEQVKPSLTRVVWADDTEVSHEEEFEPGEPVKLHPKGLGGTDMRKPLKYVEKYDPEIVILITDGYTPWPKNVPYNLIVACNTSQRVPIGRVIRLT